MNEAELRDRLAGYSFYHSIALTENVVTRGIPFFVAPQRLCMKRLRSMDLRGKRVLDVGCRDGLFAFAAESMGAAEVVAIDNDLSRAATELLIPALGSKVSMRQMNLYDLRPESFGLFDVVILPGVLYHLRYPFWALKVIREVMKPGGQLLIETALWQARRNQALLFCPVGDESPYEPSSCSFFNRKGLTDTLRSLGFTTTAVERLSLASPAVGARERWHLLMHFALAAWKRVTRWVLLCTLEDAGRQSRLAGYWERTHDFHSRPQE